MGKGGGAHTITKVHTHKPHHKTRRQRFERGGLDPSGRYLVACLSDASLRLYDLLQLQQQQQQQRGGEEGSGGMRRREEVGRVRVYVTLFLFVYIWGGGQRQQAAATTTTTEGCGSTSCCIRVYFVLCCVVSLGRCLFVC